MGAKWWHGHWHTNRYHDERGCCPKDPAADLLFQLLSCAASPLFWLYFPPTPPELPAFAAVTSSACPEQLKYPFEPCLL